MPSESAVAQVWIWSLVIYFVVVGVVAVLLTMILNTVKQIKGGAAAIWTSGSEGGEQHHSDSSARADQPLRHKDSGFGRADGGGSGRCRAARRFVSPLPDVRDRWTSRGTGMNTFVILMIVTLVGVAALFIALALFVRAIVRELEGIGGPATRFVRPVNYLSKIRLGLRAIEVHTGHIAPQVTQLNQTLTSIRDGLRAIDASLAGTIAHVQRQEQR